MKLSDVGGIVCYQMVHRDGTRNAACKCSKSLCSDCFFLRNWMRLRCGYESVSVKMGQDIGLIGEDEIK